MEAFFTNFMLLDYMLDLSVSCEVLTYLTYLLITFQWKALQGCRNQGTITLPDFWELNLSQPGEGTDNAHEISTQPPLPKIFKFSYGSTPAEYKTSYK